VARTRSASYDSSLGRADFVTREHSGRCWGRLARTTSSSHGSSTRRISRLEEEQRVEGLVLGGRGDAVTDCERGQEGRDFRVAHLRGMALAVEEDVALDPVDVRLLGPAAVVP